MVRHDVLPRTLDKGTLVRGAEVLARAFQGDPLMQFLYPEVREEPRSPARFYRAVVRMGLLYGEAHATSEMESVAVWVRPGSTDFGFGQMARSGFLAATLMAGPRKLRRFVRMAGFMEKTTKPILARRHWHLMMIGVDPRQQGKGMGGMLMAPMLERADTERTPCMLESANERNLGFYTRHGFAVAAEVQIPDDGPRVWLMVREPVS